MAGDPHAGGAPAGGRPTPLEALRRHWGYATFRPLQAEAVDAAMAGADALVVLPTGGGKSLCYQVPAACGAGLVLVVSPLIALMDDQVAAAREVGLRAGALHGNLDPAERRRVRESLDDGSLDLLYVSPERLAVGDVLARHAARVALLAVDEAHCVSHWGHDFRPEYRQLGGFFADCPGVPRMALTATATPQVQADIVEQLGLRSPVRLVGHVDRPNLVYRVRHREQTAKQVLDVIRRHPGAGGIVYALTRKDVERLAETLRREGVDAAAYHAGLPADERARVQGAFVNERLAVVVATIAFGMGIDRSDVRYVVHANVPKSVEHYQQESGRAGRDGEPAECVLLFSAGDLALQRGLARRDDDLPAERARALDRQLKEIARYATAPVCRHRLLAQHFGQTYPPDPGPASAGGCGACDVCLGETEELPAEDALVTAQKILSAVWRTGSKFGVGHVADVLLGRSGERISRLGHDRLSVYGLLKDSGETSLRAWIDQLVVQEFLAITADEKYPLLVITEEGRRLCQGRGSVRLGRPIERKRERSARGRAAEGPVATPDAALFERLRQLRRRLAELHHVAPYMVFHDSTLRALAAEKPMTLEAMREVKGVGDYKLERYGADFIAAIKDG